MTRRLFAAFAALAILALAACSSHPGASPSASPSTLTNDQALALGRQAAQCMRDHGIPDFPDPILDQHGQIALPPDSAEHVKQELGANPDAQRACQSIIDRLPIGNTH